MNIENRLQLDAPIIPGHSAAGIPLGISESELVAILGPGVPSTAYQVRYFRQELWGRVYESPDVNIWIKSNAVDQIGVRGNYRGLLHKQFGPGCFARELTALGEIGEDEEDNLIIRGIPGFCFEVFTLSDAERQDFATWRVEWFFVFKETMQQWRPLTL